MVNKRKIINDPVYGFLNLTDDFIFDLISHPYFQRLRHIKQLGLSNLVYPGAEHTRFAHALGAMHLMCQAIEVLRQKGQNISEKEAQAALIAILLHDIGHGPFSHSLEHFFFQDLSHEQLSSLLMQRLHETYGGMDLAIEIFENRYEKKFLHQLVSSQIDTDRLDYLTRDSFFTGVSEGVIGTERIIKMLAVNEDELVVDEKGIYSIEKFILSRRLMYWQVYMHKTVVAAERILLSALQRARYLAKQGEQIFCTPNFCAFLPQAATRGDLLKKTDLLEIFSQMNDADIWICLQNWSSHAEDPILRSLSKAIIDRKLPRVEIQNIPFEPSVIEKHKALLAKKDPKEGFDPEYWILTGELVNRAYDFQDERINILYKSGQVKEISIASDQLDQAFLAKTIKKYFLVYPK